MIKQIIYTIFILSMSTTLNHNLFSQETIIEKLESNIAILEQRITELERKVALLEQNLQDPQTDTIQPSEKWKDRSLWRSLRRNMSMKEVEDLLGVPRKISGGAITRWNYSEQGWHSYVKFYEGRVSSWTEPR